MTDDADLRELTGMNTAHGQVFTTTYPDAPQTLLMQEYRALEEENRHLRDTLDWHESNMAAGREWDYSGLWLIRKREGSTRMEKISLATEEELERVAPRAALLLHRDALIDALMEYGNQVRENLIRYDDGTVLIQWGSAHDLASLILGKIADTVEAENE